MLPYSGWCSPSSGSVKWAKDVRNSHVRRLYTHLLVPKIAGVARVQCAPTFQVSIDDDGCFAIRAGPRVDLANPTLDGLSNLVEGLEDLLHISAILVVRPRPNHLLNCLRGSRRAPSDDCDSVSWKRAIGSLSSSALNVLVHCSTFLTNLAWRCPAYVGSSWRVRYNRSMSARMSMTVDKKNRLMSDTAALASSSEPILPIDQVPVLVMQ